jgi:hypothetical protein
VGFYLCHCQVCGKTLEAECCRWSCLIALFPYSCSWHYCIRQHNVPFYVMAHLRLEVSRTQTKLHICQAVACTMHVSSHMLIRGGLCSLLSFLKQYSTVPKT